MLYSSLEELITVIHDSVYTNNAGLVTAEIVEERMIDIIDTVEGLPLAGFEAYLEAPNTLETIFVGNFEVSLENHIHDDRYVKLGEGGIPFDISEWFELAGEEPNQYLRCKYPFAGDYEIQAFSDTGWLPPDIWESIPYATGGAVGGIKVGSGLAITDGVLSVDGGVGTWGQITGTLTDQTDLVDYVAQEIADLVDSSPSTLDTLNELAAALGDDPNFATTMTNLIGAKAPLANPVFTGTVKVGTIGASIPANGLKAQEAVGAVSGNKILYLYNDGNTLKLDAYEYSGAGGLNFTLGGNGGNVTVAGKLGIGESPLAKLYSKAAGDFGADDNSNIGVAGLFHTTSDSTVVGFLNKQNHQCFAINIGASSDATHRGAIQFFDKYDGSWHQALTLYNGNVYSVGEITAFYSSDRRLKKNISDFSALDIIDQLHPVKYKWNEKALELNPKKDDRWNFGFIAQEMEEVLPEIVHPIYEKYKGLDDRQIIAILAQGMKELREELNSMKACQKS